MGLPRDRARVAVGLLIAALLVLDGVVAARGALWYQSGDFFCIYQGARSLVLGHDPYDAVWWASITGGIVPDPFHGIASTSCTMFYPYPLWDAVLLLPLGLFPLEVAASLWMAISIGAAVFGIVSLWRAYGGTSRYAGLFAALVVASQPFSVFLVGGQSTAILLGLLGACSWSAARGRERTAGAALALLALKPQLVVLTLPAVLLRAIADRRSRLVRAAIVTGLLMVVVPLAFVPLWPVEWLGNVGASRLDLVRLLPTAWGFATDVLGDPAWGALVALGLVAACAFLVRDRSMPVVIALTLPLSLFVTPHAWSYDFLICAPSWAFVLARSESAPRSSGRWMLLGVLVFASVLPWILYAVGRERDLERLSAVIPAGTALLVAAVARVRRGTAT